MPRNTSLFKIPQCITRSAFEINFIANASSRKPKTIFTVFIHPPDLGKEFNQLGNIANKAKGNPKARPKPAIATVKGTALPPWFSDPTIKEPSIGPVHEKETIHNVRAMKKMPPTVFASDLASTVLEMLPGRLSSKYPKNESANSRKMIAKKMLSQALVEILFKISELPASRK